MDFSELIQIFAPALSTLAGVWVILRKLEPERESLQAATIGGLADATATSVSTLLMTIQEMKTSVAEAKGAASNVGEKLERMRRKSMEKDIKHDGEIAGLDKRVVRLQKENDALKRELDEERKKRQKLQVLLDETLLENKKMKDRLKKLESEKKNDSSGD